MRRAGALHLACPAGVPLPHLVLAPHFGSWFLLSSVSISFRFAHFVRSHLGSGETLALTEEATPFLGPPSPASRPGLGSPCSCASGLAAGRRPEPKGLREDTEPSQGLAR